MGIVGFTYSCANGLSRYGVTSNAIAPGAATRMTESIPDEPRRMPQEGDERAPLPRGGGEGPPENVAPAVAYLAREASTGATDRSSRRGGTPSVCTTSH